MEVPFGLAQLSAKKRLHASIHRLVIRFSQALGATPEKWLQAVNTFLLPSLLSPSSLISDCFTLIKNQRLAADGAITTTTLVSGSARLDIFPSHVVISDAGAVPLHRYFDQLQATFDALRGYHHEGGDASSWHADIVSYSVINLPAAPATFFAQSHVHHDYQLISSISSLRGGDNNVKKSKMAAHVVGTLNSAYNFHCFSSPFDATNHLVLLLDGVPYARRDFLLAGWNAADNGDWFMVIDSPTAGGDDAQVIIDFDLTGRVVNDIVNMMKQLVSELQPVKFSLHGLHCLSPDDHSIMSWMKKPSFLEYPGFVAKQHASSWETGVTFATWFEAH